MFREHFCAQRGLSYAFGTSLSRFSNQRTANRHQLLDKNLLMR